MQEEVIEIDGVVCDERIETETECEYDKACIVTLPSLSRSPVPGGHLHIVEVSDMDKNFSGVLTHDQKKELEQKQWCCQWLHSLHWECPDIPHQIALCH